MKAEDARKLVEEYLNDQENLRIRAIEKRIESGLYNQIFIQVKMAAGSGKNSVNIYVKEPKIDINIQLDLRHLGYKMTRLDVRNGVNYKINWGTI